MLHPLLILMVNCFSNVICSKIISFRFHHSSVTSISKRGVLTLCK